MKTASLPRTLALLATALVLSACGRHAVQAPPAEKPIFVQLASIIYSTDAVPIEATGVISRLAESDLSFKIAGIVEAVNVRAGDSVEKDQVLASLRLDEVDAQVMQARSALDKAKRDFARVEKLRVDSVATLENLQDTQTALDVAAAQLRIAEFNRRYAVITSPTSGRILRRTVEPNELVAPGKPALVFAANDDGWLVRAALAEVDIARARVGDRAEFARRNRPPLKGRITHIAEAVEPVTRNTPIEITIDGVPDDVRSGFVGTATIFPQAVPERSVVPAAALVEGAGTSASLFVVEPGQAHARRLAVEIETLGPTRAYLRTPLPPSARLIVSGAEYLRDGAMIAEAKP